jgi:propanediol dehydratase small subunit
MNSEPICSKTERPLSELTLESVLAGDLTVEDLSISADTLRRQADAVGSAGYIQFAENLRRAAELTQLSNEEVLEIYGALRPGRATYAELVEIADHLESDLEAPMTAGLIREAAEVYLERRIVG